jgi:hypothetical protein
VTETAAAAAELIRRTTGPDVPKFVTDQATLARVAAIIGCPVSGGRGKAAVSSTPRPPELSEETA